MSLPTKEDYNEILSFLPILYPKGERQNPIAIWKGGERLSDGSTQIPYPVYAKEVDDFIDFISNKECFQDYNYCEQEPETILADSKLISNASLEQIKSILTYIHRGERFCDGHWEGLIKSGEVKLVLERIEILSKDPNQVA